MFVLPLLSVLLSFIDLLHVVHHFLFCHPFHLPQMLAELLLFIALKFVLKAQFLIDLVAALGSSVVMLIQNRKPTIVSNIVDFVWARTKVFLVPLGVVFNFFVCLSHFAELPFIVPVVHQLVENTVFAVQKGLVLELVFLHRTRRVLET